VWATPMVFTVVAFLMVGYGRDLRGEEIPKLEITGLLKHFDEGDRIVPKHVMLSLVGRFNQEDGEMQPFLPVAAGTGSGLRIRDWARRLLELKVRSGQTQGFLFRRKKGSPVKMVWIQENTQGLIHMTIDLWEVNGCRISMR
jgi:hypothetical protein